MNPGRSSEPPEDPLNIAEPQPLSPASPKPIHFPVPTSIPVLEMQMDVGFNQTEVHMSDPAMHNTDVRPDFWRDPNEEQQQQQQEEQRKRSVAMASQHHDGQQDIQQDIEEASLNTDNNTDSIDALTSIQPTSSSILPIHASQDVSSDMLEEKVPTSSMPETLAMPFSGISANLADPAPVVLHGMPSIAENMTLNAQAPVVSQSVLPSGMSTSSREPQSSLTQNQFQPQQSTLLGSQENASESLGLDVDAKNVSREQLPVPVSHDEPTNSQSAHTQPIDVVATSELIPTSVSTFDNAAQDSLPINSIKSGAPTPSSLGQSAISVPASSTALSTSHSPSGLLPLTQNTSPTNTRAINTPIESRRESKLAAGQTVTDDDRPWDAEIQRKYDRFIEDERKYVSEGRWEQFAHGSRLFVGNLSSEKVTKRDIFHIFHHYGNLAQISIKQAYGFVQFLHAEDCAKALNAEQGTQIRDKRIHLEVSKPQKGRGPDKNKDRRSRSPDHRRGGKATVDRYVSGGSTQNTRGRRGSNSRRSPTPPRYRDRYDDRYRDQSPDNYGRNRYRSPSPRRDADDDLPLPRRAPHDVPDVQILVLDNLDRDFISWVEGAFSTKGVRVDVLLLSPRLSEQAVVRRQIVEGVTAVSKLMRRNQDTGKIGLQIFDRSAGVNNIKFEEYDHLDPPICAELVLRAKKTQQTSNYSGIGQYSTAPATAPNYNRYEAPSNPYSQPAPPSGYGQHGFPPKAAHPPAPNSHMPPANIQHLISSLDPNALQNLLSAMNRQPGTTASQPAPNFSNPSGGYANQQQPQPQHQQQSAALAALQQNPQALAGLLQQQPPFASTPTTQPSAGNPSSVNMQDILARLGTYNKP